MQSDHDRRELYLALHDLLGPGPAGTLMELLPPVGWSDLARQSDLTAGLASVRGEIAEVRGEIAELRGEIAEVRGDLTAGLASVRGEIAELRGEMGELRGELAKLSARIDAQIPKFIWANVPVVASVAGLVLATVKFA